jgi:hypothetical protein
LSDDDITSPDLPSGLGASEEPTDPGVGTGAAYIATTASRDRALAALAKLERTCPAVGAPGRRRHLELIAIAQGDAGMLFFDGRRVTNQLIHEEFDT